jgi:hypothetical protein
MVSAGGSSLFQIIGFDELSPIAPWIPPGNIQSHWCTAAQDYGKL